MRSLGKYMIWKYDHFTVRYEQADESKQKWKKYIQHPRNFLVTPRGSRVYVCVCVCVISLEQFAQNITVFFDDICLDSQVIDRHHCQCVNRIFLVYFIITSCYFFSSCSRCCYRLQGAPGSEDVVLSGGVVNEDWTDQSFKAVQSVTEEGYTQIEIEAWGGYSLVRADEFSSISAFAFDLLPLVRTANRKKARFSTTLS